MAGISVFTGVTQRVTATFYGWDDDGASTPEDPSVVEVRIYDTSTSPDSLLSTHTATDDPGVGSFSYLWTPTQMGDYNVQIWGQFSDGSTAVGNNFFDVSEDPITPSGLSDDFELVFLPALAPLYIDPDEILAIFPDAEYVEALEYIYFFSLEVDTLRGSLDITPTMVDYVRAATACSLSKIYDYGGVGDEISVRLGDLSVANRSFPKSEISRGTATTWCELAAALREEMLRGRGVGMKAIVRGSDYCNPMPPRQLRRIG